MNLGVRPWIITALFSVLHFMPAISRAGMTAEEVKSFNSYKSLADVGT